MAREPLITTRFDATSTADDVVRGLDLHGRQALVTGASSGLGAETARALTAAGAVVTLAVRNVGAGAAAAEHIAVATGRADRKSAHWTLPSPPASPPSSAGGARRWTSW